MKVLVTGGSGLLGQYLNKALSKENEILTLYNLNIGNCKAYNSLKTDITSYYELKQIFLSFKPDVVFHSAAISKPELCETLPSDQVLNVNVESAKNFSELCEINNVKLIFTSTDLVYGGDQGMMLKEDAVLKPVSFYAETKIMAEEVIKKTFNNYIILRTSLLFGLGINHSTNNFHSMYQNFLQNKKVKLFYDQFRTPLALADAARLIELLLKFDLKNITFNFGGKERVSRLEIGEILCRVGNFDNSLIEGVSMKDSVGTNKVADVSMDTSLMQSFGLMQRSIEASILEAIDH